MTIFGIQKPGFMMPVCYKRVSNPIPWPWMITMTTNSHAIKKQELQLQTNLQFDRLQQVYDLRRKKHEFGQFVAREAVLDQEFWTAAWLRAETHWEDRKDDRFADSYKRKFTEQEYNALKRQSETKFEQRSSCIVTIKKGDGSERQTVLKSVVGTLDVSIRPFLHGETFPGEKVKAHIYYSIERKDSKNIYGYIANLCVAKSARRQGIARNMLDFAIESAISDGAELVYVHVHRNNIAARELYHKIGFKVVDTASPQLSRDKTYLLCYRA